MGNGLDGVGVMAKITSVNNTPETGAEAMFEFKETLKLAGWTVPRSSDGTTYNASGDQISQAGSGANGMANNRAWFVVQNPNGERSWCVQRSTASNQQWYMKYSALDLFTGGTPGVTQVPAAGDEEVVHGALPDGGPTFSNLFDADGSFRWHVIAQDAATGAVGNEVFGFWAFATEAGTGDLETILMQEPTDPSSYPPLVGTRAAPTTGDPDPVIVLVQYSTSGGHLRTTPGQTRGWTDSSVNNNKMAWYQYNDTNNGVEAFGQIQGAHLQGDPSPLAAFVPGQMGTNPYDGSEEVIPLYCGRPAVGYTTQIGAKGMTAFIKHKATIKDYPSVINSSTDAYVYIEDCLIPWEDGTLPVV